ncbi:unnamed protein product [Linum trigynum]|uniref:DUF4283 domain-containing protein n=1 Tax=Linum trigynum TaxID=586398 RepID=A0AAV2CTR0_9ROSI
MDEWYTAESDSEDIAAAIREDGQEATFDGEEDPKCPPIQFSAAEERLFCRDLRSALVVKALGRSVSYTAMSLRLNTIWAKAGGIQVTSMKKGYFLIRFTSGLDYERAITGGPWMIGPSYLTVHMWDKYFNPYEHEISSTVVWARLLELPIQYFHQEAVMKIGRRMGKPIRIDAATRTKARSDYARVCVQVDLTKPLLSQFTINGKKYFIQYEGLDKICLSCGTYSELGACPCTKTSTPMEDDSHVGVNQTPVDEPQRDALYGDWMIAKRKPRQPNREQSTRTHKEGGHLPLGKGQSRNPVQGSRFDVLRGDDMQENSVDQPAPVGGVALEGEIPNTHVKLKNKSKTSDVGTKHAAPMQPIPLERVSSHRGPSIEDQLPKTPQSATLNASPTADESDTTTTPLPAALISEVRKVHSAPPPVKTRLGDEQPDHNLAKEPPDDNGIPKGPRKAHSGETRIVSTTSSDGINPSAK